VSALAPLAPPGAGPDAVGTPPVLPARLPLGFELDEAHEAHEPVEAGGRRRDDVRLMVSVGDEEPRSRRFVDLPDELHAGDLLVVNSSATVAAAVDARLDDGTAVVVHVSTALPGGLWMVEVRHRLPGGSTEPFAVPGRRRTVLLSDGTGLDLLRPAPGSQRLWLAAPDDGVDLLAVLRACGRPIRYRYVRRDWPLAAYQSVFAVEPGSAEMASAARPFTPEIVARLVARGIAVAPLTLHTGVSSLEGHELPYPERYRVPASTAALLNAVRAAGGRVIAVGTTVVRALETVADAHGTVHPGAGWTDVVVTPDRGVRAVDGLLTGWHEPAATHLAMLEAVAGRAPLLSAYRAAWAGGYLWHEFGDSHLLVRQDPRP
jgi:S-adenosylmethionine:tRNA ribosyltransferase-isomerase